MILAENIFSNKCFLVMMVVVSVSIHVVNIVCCHRRSMHICYFVVTVVVVPEAGFVVSDTPCSVVGKGPGSGAGCAAAY